MAFSKNTIHVVGALAWVFVGIGFLSCGGGGGHVAAAYLGEGLSAGTAIKSHVAVFYHMNERFPSSNRELDLPPPRAFAGQSLTSLRVSDGGVITMTFDEKTGVEGGILRLVPKIGPASIEWKCVTPSYEWISSSIPACELVED